MPRLNPVVASLALAVSACTPEADRPAGAISKVSAEALVRRSGFGAREVKLVDSASSGGTVTRHQLQLAGVPIWGLEAKTVRGEAHFPELRYAVDQAVETVPRVTEAQAMAAAARQVRGESPRLTRATLVLLPREEQRLRPGAPDPELRNAAHFERVITGLTLAWRLEIETGPAGSERAWGASVDARSGQVIQAGPLELDVFQTVTGHGFYDGDLSFLTAVDPVAHSYALADLHGNVYQALIYAPDGSFAGQPYTSTDAIFGDGKLFSRDPTSANGETAAVDAFYAVNMTWAFFNVVLNRNGPNGAGRGYPIQLHWREDNAGFTLLGDAPRIQIGYRSVTPDPVTRLLKPLASTDIIAHELGHDYFYSLLYDGTTPTLDPSSSEFNGMNEATGDIIGFLTELYRDATRTGRTAFGGASLDSQVPKAANYTIGEETGPAYRNVLTPLYPEWFAGIGALNVHASGGPVGRMFLLLAYGCQPYPASGTPGPFACRRAVFGFPGIGPTAAARIWHNTLEVMPLGASISDARDLALAAAAREDTVFGGPKTKAVASAFAAVNVGPLPDSNPPTATFSCRQVVHDVICSGDVTDAESPNQFSRPPRIGVDGVWDYPLTSWHFTQTIPGATLSTGSHAITLTAWDLWQNPVSVTVNVSFDGSGPAASLNRSGQPKHPVFDVTASDPSGVAQIVVLDGATSLGQLTSPPWSWTFDTSNAAVWSDGSHPLTFNVYDNFQNLTVLGTALVVDNRPPAVSLSVGGAAAPFTLTASATDASALVRADFKRDGTLLGSVSGGSPYTFSYAPSDALAHTLSVVVTDAFGNQGSASRAAPLDTQPPAVTFSAHQWGAAVTLNFGASDPCGIQYPYTAWVDGGVIAQPATPGFTFVLPDSLPPGTHIFQLVASDRCGNQAVYQNTFAKVFTPPAIGPIVRDDSMPKKPKFTVPCTDPDGVHHVEVRKNGVVLQIDTTEPYEFVIDTSAWQPDGSSILIFQCMDIYGVGSDVLTQVVHVDNTGPTFGFSVFGSGHEFVVSADSVADHLHGIASVELAAGLGFPGFDVTLTSPPYFVDWVIPSNITVISSVPFLVTATDTWGNATTKGWWCDLSTSATTNAYLNCVPDGP